MFFNEAVAALRNAGCSLTTHTLAGRALRLTAWHGTHEQSFDRCQHTGHFPADDVTAFVGRLRSLDKRDLGVV